MVERRSRSLVIPGALPLPDGPGRRLAGAVVMIFRVSGRSAEQKSVFSVHAPDARRFGTVWMRCDVTTLKPVSRSTSSCPKHLEVSHVLCLMSAGVDDSAFRRSLDYGTILLLLPSSPLEWAEALAPLV